MKTFFKSLFVIFGILVLLLIGMIQSVDVNKYKYLFEQQLNKVLGMDVMIQGPMEIHFLPSPHINLKNVKINYDLKKDSALNLTINDLFLEISWNSFFEEIMTIKALDAKDINVHYMENQKSEHTFKIDRIAAQMISTFQHLEVPSFSVALENIKMNGNFNLSFDQNRLTLNGNLKIPKYQVLLSKEALLQITRDVLKKLNRYLNFRDVKVDLIIIIDKLQYADKIYDNTNLKVNFKNKVLNLHYFANSGNDHETGNMTITAKEVRRASD